MSNQNLNILNRKARYEYNLEKPIMAGIKLLGSEIKSIREGDVNINDAYCYFIGDELFIKNMYIKEYEQAYTGKNHEPRRDRKLLLNRSELDKLKKKTETKGYTIIPLKLFLTKKGWAKIDIALAKGKNTVDKRNTIKDRDISKAEERKIKL